MFPKRLRSTHSGNSFAHNTNKILGCHIEVLRLQMSPLANYATQAAGTIRVILLHVPPFKDLVD